MVISEVEWRVGMVAADAYDHQTCGFAVLRGAQTSPSANGIADYYLLAGAQDFLGQDGRVGLADPPDRQV
jgi:hypothetical protein